MLRPSTSDELLKILMYYSHKILDDSNVGTELLI